MAMDDDDREFEEFKVRVPLDAPGMEKRPRPDEYNHPAEALKDLESWRSRTSRRVEEMVQDSFGPASRETHWAGGRGREERRVIKNEFERESTQAQQDYGDFDLIGDIHNPQQFEPTGKYAGQRMLTDQSADVLTQARNETEGRYSGWRQEDRPEDTRAHRIQRTFVNIAAPLVAAAELMPRDRPHDMPTFSRITRPT